MMSPFTPYGPSWASVGGTTWIENAQGEERVRISVTAKEKLKFWPTEAVVQYRLREQGAHAKPLLAKLEDQTERFRRAVEAIDLALAGQPHGDDNDDHDDKPASKTGDNARVAEEARLPSPARRTIGFAFPTNVPPPPWATTAPMTPPTQTRTPTATRGNDDDVHDRDADADADEEPSRRASGGGGRSYWDDFATTASGSSPPRGSGAGGGGRSSWDDFATTARSSSPPRDSGADGGGRSYWGDFGTTARSSSPPPPFSLPPVVRRQSNLPSASVPSAYPAPTVRRVGGCTAGGGAYAVVDLERRAPKRPLSLKELCEGLVVSAVALDNVMDVLSAVGRHSDVVKEHCLKFIGRNFSRARKVKEIRAALEGTVGAYAEWDTAAVRRHMENTPRVRVEAVVLGPKEKDNNAMPTYGQPMVQPPGFSAYRDCYVVIPLPPRAATEAAGPTDDAEAALEANRRVTGVIDSLLRQSFLPYQLQLAQGHLSFAYSTSQFVAKFVSHAKTDPLPEEVMNRLRDKAHGIALAQATAQGLGTLRLRSTNVSGHVQRKAPTDMRSPMDIVGLSSHAYAPIVYQAQLQATFEVTPAQP